MRAYKPIALESRKIFVLQLFKGHIKLHSLLPVTSVTRMPIGVGEKYMNLSGNAYSFQLEQYSLWTPSTLVFYILALISIL